MKGTPVWRKRVERGEERERESEVEIDKLIDIQIDKNIYKYRQVNL